MPIHLRIFYYRKLVETKEKEKQASEGNKSTSSPPPRGPSIRQSSNSGKVRMG